MELREIPRMLSHTSPVSPPPHQPHHFPCWGSWAPKPCLVVNFSSDRDQHPIFSAIDQVWKWKTFSFLNKRLLSIRPKAMHGFLWNTLPRFSFCWVFEAAHIKVWSFKEWVGGLCGWELVQKVGAHSPGDMAESSGDLVPVSEKWAPLVQYWVPLGELKIL